MASWWQQRTRSRRGNKITILFPRYWLLLPFSFVIDQDVYDEPSQFNTDTILHTAIAEECRDRTEGAVLWPRGAYGARGPLPRIRRRPMKCHVPKQKRHPTGCQGEEFRVPRCNCTPWVLSSSGTGNRVKPRKRTFSRVFRRPSRPGGGTHAQERRTLRPENEERKGILSRFPNASGWEISCHASPRSVRAYHPAARGCRHSNFVTNDDPTYSAQSLTRFTVPLLLDTHVVRVREVIQIHLHVDGQGPAQGEWPRIRVGTSDTFTAHEASVYGSCRTLT